MIRALQTLSRMALLVTKDLAIRYTYLFCPLKFDCFCPKFDPSSLKFDHFCNLFQGQCERTMQDVVERIWDFIDDFNINSVLKFLKDNVVGTVVVISLIFWVPISCLISYVDKKRARKVAFRFYFF